jgi:serine protease
MKHHFFLLLLLFPTFLFAQSNIVPYFIILKVKQFNANAFASNPSADATLIGLPIKSVKPKYPHAVKPKSGQADKHGNAFIDLTRTYILELNESSNLDAAITKLNSTGVFEWVEATTYAQSFYTPNDPQIGSEDHLLHANIYTAWDSTQGDTNVIMGITDTSFDLLHEDVQSNLKYNYADPINGNDDDNDGYIDNYRGWDIWGNDNNLFFTNEWHGTGVLGVAAATTNNSLGLSGVGFKCKYLPVKIGNDATSSTIITADGHNAITYCADRDCKVINCSWGTLTFSNDGQDVVNYATINKNAVVVAAAGNTNAEQFRYPASFHRALSVTGINNSDEYDNGVNTPFTRNDSVDVCAQGFNVMASATVGASGSQEVYQTTGGTSIAAPIVSGIVALVRSIYPCLSAIEVIDLVINTAVDIESIGTNSTYTGKIGKRIDAYAAMQINQCLGVGVEELMEENTHSVLIYPNPAEENVTFELSKADNWIIHIYDVAGKLLIKQQLKGNRITLSNLKSGVYVAEFSNADSIISKRFSIID